METNNGAKDMLLLHVIIMSMELMDLVEKVNQLQNAVEIVMPMLP